jgi:hypothetical protein
VDAVNALELKFSVDLSMNNGVVFRRALLMHPALLATMTISHVVLCVSPYNAAALVEIMPTQPVATTSLFCEEHICGLSSQPFQGLL